MFAGFARTEELFGIVLICATQLQTATYGGYQSLSSAKVLSYAPPVCPAPTPSVLRAPSTNLRDHAILLSMILANDCLGNVGDLVDRQPDSGVHVGYIYSHVVMVWALGSGRAGHDICTLTYVHVAEVTPAIIDP